MVAGERAGLDIHSGRSICLWCLADLKAGRTPPRRRASRGPSMHDVTIVRVPEPASMPPARQRARVTPRRARRPGSGPRTSVTLLIVAAVLAGAAYLDNAVLGHDSIPRALGLRHLPGVSTGGGIAGVGSKASDYAFAATKKNGEPVAFSSCDPIHIVVNGKHAVPDADRMLREALDRVSEASGLTFVVDGPSQELPDSVRAATNTSTMTWTNRPALVAWLSPQEDEGLGRDAIGLGGPIETGYYIDANRHYVTGTVSLDGPALQAIMLRPNGWAQARAVVMHEVGHMVGLGHVDSTAEVMAPKGSHITEFGAGDREGLRLLGDGPCF